MKYLRLALLLFLTLLLSVRGAVAAAMMCPPAGPSPHLSAVAVTPELAAPVNAAGKATDHSPGHDHRHGNALHLHTHAGLGGDVADDHAIPLNSQDKCDLCAASCCATTLMSAPLQALQPPQTMMRVPPGHGAPVPSFFSDGQERPPRSI